MLSIPCQAHAFCMRETLSRSHHRSEKKNTTGKNTRGRREGEKNQTLKPVKKKKKNGRRGNAAPLNSLSQADSCVTPRRPVTLLAAPRPRPYAPFGYLSACVCLSVRETDRRGFWLSRSRTPNICESVSMWREEKKNQETFGGKTSLTEARCCDCLCCN